MALLFALSLALVLAVENKAVRADQNAMRYAYGSFLARRVKGQPLSSLIRQESLAVFKSQGGIIACAVVKGG